MCSPWPTPTKSPSSAITTALRSVPSARYGNDVEPKALSQIVLEVLSFLDDIAKERERLVEISVDGRIADDELRDFARIKSQLDDIAQTVDALQLWLEKTIAADGIDAEVLQEYLKDE